MSEPDDSIWRRPDPEAEAAPGPGAEATPRPEAEPDPRTAGSVPEPAAQVPVAERMAAAAYVPAMPAPVRQLAQGPSLARSIVVLLLFAAGVAAGIAGYVGLNPGPAPAPYPPLTGAPEPEAAHALAAALKTNDADALASRVLPPIASALSNALQPIVEVTDVTYLGTVEHDGRDLAGYIVSGRDVQNQDQIVGIVVDVMDGSIVGING